jgi:hypothetical protein
VIASFESEKTPLKYSGIPGHWDEAVLPSGIPRRHWRGLYVEVGRMGLSQLHRRWSSGQQLIQSEGVTYNPASLPEGSEYMWPMDPIPMAIDESEWMKIEAAVVQRARLFNAILSDLYGEQRLLHGGIYRRRLCSRIPISCARVSESSRSAVFICTATLSTLRVRPTADGGSLEIEPRRRRAWAIRFRTG